MSEEQLKAFMEAVKADEGLQKQFKAATDVNAVVAIAREAGFVISAEELERDQGDVTEDDELEAVTGGVGERSGMNYCAGRRFCLFTFVSASDHKRGRHT